MRKYWRYAVYWLWQTPERSLNAAYNAALEIKRIENEYFGGKKISLPAEYSENVVTYIKAELSKYLQIIQNRLAEFKLSNSLLNLFPIDVSSFSENSDTLEVDKVNLTYDSKIVEVKAVTCRTINKL